MHNKVEISSMYSYLILNTDWDMKEHFDYFSLLFSIIFQYVPLFLEITSGLGWQMKHAFFARVHFRACYLVQVCLRQSGLF